VRSLLLALALLLPAPLGQEAPDAAAANAALEAVAEHFAEAPYHALDYVQRQHSLLTTEPLVTKGRLWVRREPPVLLFHAADRTRSAIRMDGVSHQVWLRERGRAERYLFERNELAAALHACFAGDFRALDRVFELESLAPLGEGEEAALRLAFVPRSKRVARAVTRLELVLRDRELVSLAFANREGERTELDLTRVKKQPELEDPGAFFALELPEGVTLRERKVELPAD
jgi:hypothetical protein